jgi:hypothetical protein
MRTFDYKTLIAYSDHLTSDGKKLSIAWNGGGDSGEFDFKIDDVVKIELTELDEQIVKLIARKIGYGNFAGDFDVSGEVFYDPIEKCFTGNDYLYTDGEDVHKCNIEVLLPQDLWFDELQIHLEDRGNCLTAHLSLIVNNGPYPEDFQKIAPRIEQQIAQTLKSELTEIEEYAGVWYNINFLREDFIKKGSLLSCSIHEIDYSTTKVEHTELRITLLN